MIQGEKVVIGDTSSQNTKLILNLTNSEGAFFTGTAEIGGRKRWLGTSQVFQCGNAPDGQEEAGGIQELEERLVARWVLLLPLYMVPEHGAWADWQLFSGRRAAPLPGRDCLPQASGKNSIALRLSSTLLINCWPDFSSKRSVLPLLLSFSLLFILDVFYSHTNLGIIVSQGPGDGRELCRLTAYCVEQAYLCFLVQ